MPRSLHTDEFKAEAVALAVEIGPAEAARRTGVKAATLRSWCSRAGVATVASERTRAATERVKATAEERRLRLADRLLEVAEMSVEHAAAAMDGATLRDVVGLFTRAIHDHQLLTGAATARTEHKATREAAHQVIDELADRRKKHAA